MRHDRRSEREAGREAAFNAWAAWRHAAARVQAAWDDASRAPRETRAAAYAEYHEALRREENAARDLGGRLGGATRGGDLAAIAA